MAQQDHECVYTPCPICAAQSGDDDDLEQITPRITLPPDESGEEPDDPEIEESDDIGIDEALADLWDLTHDDDDDDDTS